MLETEKEYLVGTVRPTNRPEAGQETKEFRPRLDS
jgi:hypothetical protein